MKKVINKIGTMTVCDVIALIVTLVLTFVGIYLVHEVWLYEEACAEIYAVGTLIVALCIKSIGSDLRANFFAKKIEKKMEDEDW